MSEAFLGELRLMSFNYAPDDGWLPCNGQLLSINQNQALFSLLGTMYGGNGQTTFALPDLRGRVPIHAGGSFTQGQAYGEEAHALTPQEMPLHTHTLQASTAAADSVDPTSHVLAAANNGYAAPDQAQTTLRPDTVTFQGGGQVHDNMHPYIVMTWCIAAASGAYPSRP